MNRLIVLEKELGMFYHHQFHNLMKRNDFY